MKIKINFQSILQQFIQIYILKQFLHAHFYNLEIMKTGENKSQKSENKKKKKKKKSKIFVHSILL
jgi:hypothetical protein